MFIVCNDADQPKVINLDKIITIECLDGDISHHGLFSISFWGEKNDLAGTLYFMNAKDRDEAFLHLLGELDAIIHPICMEMDAMKSIKQVV